MKKLILTVFFMPLIAHAQQPFLQPAPKNLWAHVYWQALGNRSAQYWGVSGIDTLGANDSSQHALSIGENSPPGGAGFLGPVISSYVLNRKLIPFTPDTGRIYEFPGEKIIRGNLNGDPYPDFVVYNYKSFTVYILLGTDTINKFDTVVVLHDTNRVHFGGLRNGIIVADVDSSGYDGVLLFDNFETARATDTSRLLWFKGGAPFDTTPVIYQYKRAIGYLTTGHIRDPYHQYICEYYPTVTDTSKIYLYPFSRSFSSYPTDSVVIRTDSGGSITGGFALTDVFGRGIDDILIGTSSAVLVYKGGANITPEPNFIFRPLPSLLYFDYGTKIVDVGDVTGRGYHSILVTDPDVSNGGLNGGTIYLYDIGKALSDTVRAYAVGGYGEAIGTQVAAPGDLNGDGKADFIVGTYADQPGNGASGVGQVIVFSGDTSYGPVAVREPQNAPQSFTLAQNYPNPVSDATDIVFAVADSRLYGAEVTLDIYDMLGKKALTAYRGKADNYEYTIRVDVSGLPPGDYYYRLSCGGREETKMLSILK